MESSRTGETGETFAFNSEGLMISDSRFNKQLRKMGLLAENDNAILNVQLRDPGAKRSGDLSPPSDDNRPLTQVAASALRGESGFNVDGFNDYRGVPVIGAWTWLKDYGVGLVTKVDRREAFASLYIIKQLFLKLLGFLSLVMIVAVSLQNRHARTRKSLTISEERNRSVVSSAMDGIITIQPDGIIESFNPAAERIFGYFEADVIGRNVSMLMPEPYRGDHNGYLERYLRTGESRVLGSPRETVGMRIDGRIFPIELSASEMKLSDRRMFIGIVRDLTERKKAERTLRKKTVGVELLQGVAVAANEANTVEEAFQSSLDHVCRIIGWPVGHVYLLNHSKIIKLKSRFISEINRDLLVPTSLWHLGDLEKYKAFKVVTEDTPFTMGAGLPGRVWASGLPDWIVDVTRDSNFQRAFGREDLGVRAGFAFPVLMGKTTVAVLEFFFTEVVERDDDLLEVMVHMGAQLGRVIERKQAINDLEHYAEDLKRVNEELRDFTFIASHDLQEPLRKIVTFGDRLVGTNLKNLNEQGQLYLERMQKAAQYALGFIYDLLAYSKVTSEAESPKPLYLEKIVAEIIAEAQEEIERTGARIEVKSLPVIDATELQIRHLFQNLISNALKYRKKEVTPVITIDSRKIDFTRASLETSDLLAQMQIDSIALKANNGLPKASAMKFWQISVEDNGIGFDEKYAHRIFKPFKRLHSREQFPGSGMGLAICQKIVSRLGGGITARGIPDVGAKFLVYLPEKST
jgi:PAS domain S-box-containing protein